jgi:hypothetical protein
LEGNDNTEGGYMNQADSQLVAGALRQAARNEVAMRAAGLNPADVVALADEFSPSVED